MRTGKKEATGRIKVRNEGDQDLRGGEKWLDSGYHLEAKPREYFEGLV